MRTLPIVGLLLVGGCGGRALAPGDDPAVDQPDQDALILTLRHQSSIELDQQLFIVAHAALTRARGLVPALEQVHARPYEVEHELVLEPLDGRVVAAWSRGELHTGVPDLDAELQRFGATGVRSVSSAHYAVHFAPSLALPRLAQHLDRLATIRAPVLGTGSWGYPEEDIRWTRAAGREQLEFHGVEHIEGPSGCFQESHWVVDLPATSPATIEDSRNDCFCLAKPSAEEPGC